MTIGFSVTPIRRRVDRETVAAFARLPVANVSDSMHRLYGGGAQLRPMHRAGKLAGPAITVKAPPGDNLMLHKAIDMAVEGDVHHGADHLAYATDGLACFCHFLTFLSRAGALSLLWGVARDTR